MFSSSNMQQHINSSKKKYISTIKHYRCLSTSTSPKDNKNIMHNFNSHSNSNMKLTSQLKSSIVLSNSSKSKSKDHQYKTININNTNIKKHKRNNIKYINQLYPKTERKQVTSQHKTNTNNINNGKDFISIKTTSTLTSSIISNNNSQITLNTIDSIFIKLKSNWGHSSLIGLHCINLYTYHKALIKIISISISYENQHSNIQIMKHPNTLSPHHNNNNDITNIKFIKGQIAIIEIKYNSIAIIKEIEIINSKHQNKNISAKEILICNIKGELLYADTLQKGERLHIEKGINGLYIPIKHRIVVNRKQNLHNSPTPSKEHSQLKFKRVNSNDMLFKSSINQFSKTKTLSNFSNAISTNQISSILYNNRCLTSRYNKIKFDSLNNNFPSQTQRNNCNSGTYLETEHFCITCNKITIMLLENYGHMEHIGLTGIEIYDDKGMIDVADKAKGIWTQPKDLNTVYNDSNDERIFENTFNGVNNTTNQNQMWLTCIEGNNIKPYIEITFGDDVNVECIKFYNFNHPLSKDKGVKMCYILLHNRNNELIWESKIHLNKALGESDIDYGQEVRFPYEYPCHELSEEERDLILNLLNESIINKYYKCQLKNDYLVPYLPCGYTVKIELISNYGSREYVGYKGLKIYDVKGEDVLEEKEYRRMCVPKEKEGCKEKEVVMKYVNLNKEIWNDEEGGDTCNRVYYVFNEVVCITRIDIEMFVGNGNKEINVNKVKLLVEDKIVYEGEIFYDDNSNKSNNCSNGSKTIWFINH